MVAQSGSPEDLYERPESLFASGFMGTNNTLSVEVTERRDGQALVDVGGHRLWGVDRSGGSGNTEAKGVIRTEAVRIADGAGQNRLPAQYETSIYLGNQFEHLFHCGNQTIRLLSNQRTGAGRYWLECPHDRLWVFQSTRAVARHVGMSQTLVSRISRAFGLQLHRAETFELSPISIDGGRSDLTRRRCGGADTVIVTVLQSAAMPLTGQPILPKFARPRFLGSRPALVRA